MSKFLFIKLENTTELGSKVKKIEYKEYIKYSNISINELTNIPFKGLILLCDIFGLDGEIDKSHQLYDSFAILDLRI